MATLQAVFTELSGILRPYAAKLDTKKNTDKELYIDTRHIMKNRKPLFFGAVKLNKNYVSVYLMPVYTDPVLLEGISGELKARMQGKSCFNFSAIDKPLFRELGVLAKSGYAKYREQGFV